MFNMGKPLPSMFDVRLKYLNKGVRIQYDAATRAAWKEATKDLNVDRNRTRADAEKVLAQIPEPLRSQSEVREYWPL